MSVPLSVSPASALLQDSQVCSLSFALSSWEHVLVLNDAGVAGEAVSVSVSVSARVYALGVIGGVACRCCGGVASSSRQQVAAPKYLADALAC